MSAIRSRTRTRDLQHHNASVTDFPASTRISAPLRANRITALVVTQRHQQRPRQPPYPPSRPPNLTEKLFPVLPPRTTTTRSTRSQHVRAQQKSSPLSHQSHRYIPHRWLPQLRSHPSHRFHLHRMRLGHPPRPYRVPPAGSSTTTDLAIPRLKSTGSTDGRATAAPSSGTRKTAAVSCPGGNSTRTGRACSKADFETRSTRILA